VGAPPDRRWQGESLVPSLVEGSEPEKGAIYALTYHPEKARKGLYGFQRLSVRTDELHFFTHLSRGGGRLVRWREDRLDERDLTEKLPDAAAVMRELVHRKLEQLEATERGPEAR
jgi:hypothetical protein